MSLPKAQLVDPQGNMNLPGMTATGVVTATSLSGIATGSVTNLTGSPDLNVGIVTGSSFVGDGTGHAANITGTPELNLGVTTATSFVGDAVGKAAGLTGTPNLNVGLITATSFVGFVTGDVTGNISGNVVGNITGGVSGLAGALGINGINVWTGAGTSNLGVGVCTAIELHGDGSTLTGAGSTAWIAQEISANAGAETIIDLSNGNLIYYDGNSNATVGFASTSAAEQITFIRKTGGSYNTSFSTGGVTFDGTDDQLNLAATTDFQFAGDFTIEFWAYLTVAGGDYAYTLGARDTEGGYGMFYHNNGTILIYGTNASTTETRIVSSGGWVQNAWQHNALVRSGSTVTLYIDGVDNGSYTETGTFGAGSNNTLVIGTAESSPGSYVAWWQGRISNFRVVKGTAVYTGNFIPPRKQLENITNTKLLCCLDTSSTTAAIVTPGTITAVSSPTAGAQTITGSGAFSGTKSITWPDRVRWNGGTAPTLITNDYTSAFQTFRFTSFDTGLNYNGWEDMQSTVKEVSLWFWGRAAYGTSGLNDRTQRSSPAQIPGAWSPEFYGSRSNLVAVVPRTDGTLWSWGYNAGGGLLGLNDNVSRSSPTQIGADTTWKQSSTGSGKQALAIKTDGTLWSWGDNDYGDLGHNYSHNNGRVSSPTQLPGTTWKQVSADASSSTAFKTDGTLWVWGSNGDGALGLNAVTTLSSPTQVGTDTTWDSTTVTNAGDTYSRGIIKTDGTLWVWGRNQEGDLGQNKSGTIPQGGVYYSSPTQMGTGTDWASVSQCGNSGLGTKTNGTLWAWGRNNSGGLGQNNNIQYSSPVQIPGTNWSNDPQDISMQDGGGGIAWAIKTDGTLWAWGNKGSDGSLGQNQGPAQGTSVSSPIQVGTATDWAAIPGVSSGSYAVLGMRYSPSS